MIIIRSHIDPIAKLESFRALKLSRLENFGILGMEDFLNIKLSRLESFRALKLSRLENFEFYSPKTLFIGEFYGP
jgi:hypothetical protein